MRSIFISYSHKDRVWMNHLKKHLSVVQYEGTPVRAFSDADLEAGDQWPARLKKELEEAAIAVLLISPDFLDSEFIQTKELPLIRRRYELNELVIFPVLIRKCPYNWHPFLKEIQREPWGDRAVEEHHETAWNRVISDIAERILTKMERLNQSDRAPSKKAETPIEPDRKTTEDRSVLARENLLRPDRHADLNVWISHVDLKKYRVEMRFSQSPDSDNNFSLSTTIKLSVERLLNIQDPEEHGKALAKRLFEPDEIKNALSQARQCAQAGLISLRFRLCIIPNAAELHGLHWETLCCPHEGLPLALQPDIIFSRFLMCSDLEAWRNASFREAESFRYQSTALLPSPQFLEQANQKIDGFSSALDPQDRQRHNKVIFEDYDTLQANLKNHPCDVLHLACHCRQDEGEIIFDFPNGEGEPLRAHELIKALERLPRMPCLVILDTGLEHGATRRQLATLAFAPQLARIGVAGILVCQGSIRAQTWKSFLPVFLKNLRKHGCLDLAMEDARQEIRDQDDHWVPALFLRTRAARVWYTPGFLNGSAENKWNDLISQISEGICLPIIGSGIAHEVARSRQNVARTWADQEHFPMSFHERTNLSLVTQYLQIKDSVYSVRRRYEEGLHRMILKRFKGSLPRDHYSEQDLEILFKDAYELTLEARAKDGRQEPHQILAKLPFPIYLTTNINTFLNSALDKQGKKPREIIFNMSSHTTEDCLPDELETFTNENPLLYYAFGKIRHIHPMVLSEDDYFRFLLSFTKESDWVPKQLSRALSSNSLLFLGYKLDGWDFRVLLQAINKEGRFLRERFPHIAVQIDPDDDCIIDPEGARRYLEQYFKEKHNISVFWGTAEHFLVELENQWRDKHGDL